MNEITFPDKQTAIDPENPSPNEQGRAQDWNELKEKHNNVVNAIGNKIFKGLMSFDGTTVTIKTLVNTIGAIVWTNPANGQIRGTLAGTFTANKTFVSPSGLASYFVSGQRQTDDMIRFLFTYFDNTTSSTPNFTDLPFYISINS